MNVHSRKQTNKAFGPINMHCLKLTCIYDHRIQWLNIIMQMKLNWVCFGCKTKLFSIKFKNFPFISIIIHVYMYIHFRIRTYITAVLENICLLSVRERT